MPVAADARRSRRPGARVAIVLNSPRISTGASGFKSNVSRWLGAPVKKIKTTDFAFGRDAARTARRLTGPDRRKADPEQAGVANLQELATRESHTVLVARLNVLHLSATPSPLDRGHRCAFQLSTRMLHLC